MFSVVENSDSRPILQYKDESMSFFLSNWTLHDEVTSVFQTCVFRGSQRQSSFSKQF